MKKKVLAKSFPNKLITELMKREGKKSQVKIGDMREVVARIADILISPAYKCKAIRRELESYLEQKHFDKYDVSTNVNLDPLYSYYYQIDQVNKAHRKSVKKSKALGER